MNVLLLQIPYAAMGSGTLAAMSILEQGWKPQMEVGGNHVQIHTTTIYFHIFPPFEISFFRYFKFQNFPAIFNFKILPPFSVSKFPRYLQFQNFPAKNCFVPNCLCC